MRIGSGTKEHDNETMMPTGNPTNMICCLCIVSLLCLGLWLSAAEQAKQYPLAGADESTPSVAHYFSWIDNTNEGSTEAQTLANLDFFKWMHDEYGMHLDVYAFDAGNIDAPKYYGSIYSDRFKKLFPRGLDPIHEAAKSFGCRLGVWLGPDGFGNTPEEQKARTDMLVKLCRDYNFRLFKVDAVCGQLRTQKQDAFINMLKQCRKYCPDLIVINHRLNLGHALPHVTTKLWGDEAYIDVWRSNHNAATHNRACTVELGIPVDDNGKPERLVEDHGVCFSSCLDGWEDDLFLQAFSRNLILAPEMYGSPWFLRDDEFPKLARVYNLARTYRGILVNGLLLPPETYGPDAVSRGDGDTRMVVLRNAAWEPATHSVKLDETIGLTCAGPVEVRRLHPSEAILGTFKKGQSVEVTIPAFRGCVMLVSSKPSKELGVTGCQYEVVRDVPGKPAIIKLLGMPGATGGVTLPAQPRKFTKATLDGKSADALLLGGTVEVSFPGKRLTKPWHRKLADLEKCDVPADAEGLYEATCYAADNNALEIRSKLRSGPTRIKQVQKARDAFFGQKLLVERGVWDRYLFDGNMETYFRLRTQPVGDGALRVDFAKPTHIDKIVLRRANWKVYPEEAFVSADLKTWIKVPVKIEQEDPATATVLLQSHSIDKTWLNISLKKLEIDIPADAPPIRYLRIPGSAANVAEIVAYRGGKQFGRDGWRASNAFAQYSNAPAKLAWKGSFTIDEAAKGAYLVVPCIGRHGRDGAYAALRIGDRLAGAPSRAVSYPVNPWENGTKRADSGLSYFFPITEDMIAKPIEAVVLQFQFASPDKRKPATLGEITPQAWITNLPAPYESKELVLEE